MFLVELQLRLKDQEMVNAKDHSMEFFLHQIFNICVQNVITLKQVVSWHTHYLLENTSAEVAFFTPLSRDNKNTFAFFCLEWYRRVNNKLKVYIFFSFLTSNGFEKFSRWYLKPIYRWVFEYSLTTPKNKDMLKIYFY